MTKVDVHQEIIDELAATVRAASDRLGGTACARSAIDAGTPGWNGQAWSILSEQVGIHCLGLPERYGGLGGLAEMVVVAEALGAALLPTPFFSSTVLAGQVLIRCTQAAEGALQAMSGGQTVALAALGRDGLWAPATAPFTVHADGRVSGTASAVLGVCEASWLIAASSDRLVLVDLAHDSCTISRSAALDLTRSVGEVSLDRAPCIEISDAPTDVIPAAIHAAAVVLAAEQLGAAHQCLDKTVSYVKERHQFSRPVGSFQAVKHTLADGLVKVELARSALARATAGTDENPDLTESSAVARIWCNEAFRFVTAESVQLHGGIGFTWDHDAHLYFRRARGDALLLGTTTAWREQLARAMQW